MNCAEMMRSKSSGGKAKEVMRLKSEDIGAPLNFSHVVHVAPRPLVSVNLQDPHIQAFLKQAGVTEDQLSNFVVYETIVNFIHTHGVENVKNEVDQSAAVVAEVVNAPDETDNAEGKAGGAKQEAEDKREETRRDASPSFLSRLFRGKKKSVAEASGADSDKKEEMKEAASHRVEVETVEAVEKEIDEGEKLLEQEEPEEKKGKRRFSFKRKEASSADITQDEQKIEENKGSFFSRHWGKNKDNGDSKKRKAEETPVEPKKTAGLFKLNLKKTRAGSSSSMSDDDEIVTLKPEGEELAIEVAPEQPPKAEKKLNFFRNRTKKSASVDELQVEREEDRNKETSSDDEGKKKQSKREFFKIKGKKAVSVDIHHEVGAAGDDDSPKKPESPIYAQVQKPKKMFSFSKSKREVAAEVQKEYDKLENEEEKFDAVFKREAENASKLNIIPNLAKKESSRRKKNSDAAKREKANTSSLERTSTGSGFFKLGSSSKQKKASASAEQVQIPEAPRNSLPEENKHKMRKYKIKRLAGASNVSLQSGGDVTSSDEQEGAKQRRARKPRKTSKIAASKASSDEEPGMFKRIFSRRSASETRGSKREKQEKKRRSSVDAAPLKAVAENVQQTAVVAEEKVVDDPIYENFPPKVEGEDAEEKSKSTDEEADEYYAHYHNELRALTHARRSWSFVMAELKEKMTSFEESSPEEQLVFQMRTLGDEEAVENGRVISPVRLQQMKSDPNLADRRSSSSSEDDALEKIKRSIEQLDQEYFQRTQEVVQVEVVASEPPKGELPSSPEEPGYETVQGLQQQILQMKQQQADQQTLQVKQQQAVQDILQQKQQQINEQFFKLKQGAVQNENPPPAVEPAVATKDSPRPLKLPLPTRSKPSEATSSSEEEYTTPVDTSIVVLTSLSSEQRTPLSPSDSLEPDSLEVVSQNTLDSVQSPLSRTSTFSQDSLDSNQDTNNNDGDNIKVTLRSNPEKVLVRQSSSLLSNSESRPLSDIHLKIADTIILSDEQTPVIREMVVKTGRRLERGSRVSKRPPSSFSSSNEDSGSLPTSPVQKAPVLEPLIQKEVKKSNTSTSSTDSSSSKGDSIPSSTEDLAERQKQGSDNKENVKMRRELVNDDDDVFIPEERETLSLPSGKRTSVERNASYHRAVEKSGSLPLPRKNGQLGRRSSSNASRIPRPILKKPRRRTVDNWPSTHRVTEL